MNVIAESQPVPPSIPGRRIGVPRNFFNERLSPEVAAAFDRVLRAAETIGCRLVPVTVPDPAEINRIGRVILRCEAAAVLRPWLDRPEDFGADVVALLGQGLIGFRYGLYRCPAVAAALSKAMGGSCGIGSTLSSLQPPRSNRP